MCLKTVQIPVHVMIRLRAGDFFYNEEEVEDMAKLITKWKVEFEGRLSGFVFGCLKRVAGSNQIALDIEATEKLASCAKPLSITFHRAFDIVSEQREALSFLRRLGVDRVLTSGAEGRAENHLDRLSALCKESQLNSGPLIIIGGGVRQHNARKLWEATKTSELHSSTPFNIEKCP